MAEGSYAELYRRVLAGWPVPVAELDVDTPQGSTHVLAAGPDDGPPVILLPGGGATATVWGPVAGDLVAAGRRVLAVDPVGDAGRSRARGRGVRTPADLAAWWRALLSGLALDRVALVGHSYGAQIALHLTRDDPARVARLALLDPTGVVAGLSGAYVRHALPLLVAPSPARARSLLSWETDGQTLDPDWLELYAAGATGRRRVVRIPRPTAADLQALDVPALVVVAHLALAHDPARVADRFGARWPAARVEVLAGASHHTLPRIPVHELDALLVPFLAG